MRVELSEESLQDLLYISNGVFAPLNGFMGKEEFYSVVSDMCLPSGDTWTIPITLDASEEICRSAYLAGSALLSYKGKIVAELEGAEIFKIEPKDIEAVYGTSSTEHPGVRKELERSTWRIGGRVRLIDASLLDDVLSPAHTKKVFREKGFKTVAGFQTRNAIHRAHEYLQRIALEVCDGLFINPIVGWKKRGDFTEEAVLTGYRRMIEEFYPSERVYFAGLRTQMRYAGPREAIFHAIIRRNLGCTHFIIGRDHAGVGDFYGLYAAHELARKIEDRGNLGIELLLLNGPYYCERCGQVATDKTCGHDEKYRIPISGTKMRERLMAGELPDERFMRPEISKAILDLGKDNIFIR